MKNPDLSLTAVASMSAPTGTLFMRPVCTLMAMIAVLACGAGIAPSLSAADATAPVEAGAAASTPGAATVPVAAPVKGPRVEVLLDGSRSTAQAAALDRAALIVDELLPSARTLWRFDRAVGKIPTVAGAAFTSRYSDYGLAMQQVVAPLAGADPGTVVVVVGDGQEAAATPDLAPALIALAPAGSDRAQLDAAILANEEAGLTASVAARNLHFLILDVAAKPGAGGLFPWLIGQRPETARISLRGLDLGALVTEFARLGWDFGNPWIVGGGVQRCDKSLTLATPEGSPTVEVYVNALSDDGAFTVGFFTAGDHKPLPAAAADGSGSGLRVLVRDDAGVGRAYTLLGDDDGAAVDLVTSAPVQVLAFAHPHLAHAVTLAAPLTMADIFAGDTVALTHQWTRMPGGAPVSATLAAELAKDSTLYFDGRSITPIDGVTLPAAEGLGRVELRMTGPWAARVDDTPLDLKWVVAEPLVLTGGFTAGSVVAGQTVNVELRQSGGRKTLATVTATVSGPGGSTRPVALKSDGGIWKESLQFSGADLGSWTLSDAGGPAGAETAKIVIANGRYATVEITRDWMPIIIIGLLILLALLALAYVIYASLARWRDEMLERNGARFLFSALPGPKARTTSHGLPGLKGRVLFTLVKKEGISVGAFAPDVLVYINGKAVSPGAMLKPGNDLEVVAGNERIHARYFSSAAEAGTWDHQKAQIDPRSDFDHEHLIIEP